MRLNQDPLDNQTNNLSTGCFRFMRVNLLLLNSSITGYRRKRNSSLQRRLEPWMRVSARRVSNVRLSCQLPCHNVFPSNRTLPEVMWGFSGEWGKWFRVVYRLYRHLRLEKKSLNVSDEDRMCDPVNAMSSVWQLPCEIAKSLNVSLIINQPFR